jgi:hypothetical protein
VTSDLPIWLRVIAPVGAFGVGFLAAHITTTLYFSVLTLLFGQDWPKASASMVTGVALVGQVLALGVWGAIVLWAILRYWFGVI